MIAFGTITEIPVTGTVLCCGACHLICEFGLRISCVSHPFVEIWGGQRIRSGHSQSALCHMGSRMHTVACSVSSPCIVSQDAGRGRHEYKTGRLRACSIASVSRSVQGRVQGRSVCVHAGVAQTVPSVRLVDAQLIPGLWGEDTSSMSHLRQLALLFRQALDGDSGLNRSNAAI